MLATNDLSVGDAGCVVNINLEAEREVAFDSPDHIMPWGTRHDHFVNQRFNKRLWRLYPATRIVKVLDLGCAGGEFVRTCIDDGQFAVGLEGSDWSKRHKRSAWALIEQALFTCDITRPFKLSIGEHPLKFDVATAWEVIEHIKEVDLQTVARNVQAHLAPGGLWILSITNQEDVVDGVELHQTVRPKIWWRQRFESLGFESADSFIGYFARQFVRGARKDSDVSFHLIFTNDRSKLPVIPFVPLAHRMFDAWIGSRPQRILNRLVVG
jgi:SAM-dependent methyltransferase